MPATIQHPSSQYAFYLKHFDTFQVQSAVSLRITSGQGLKAEHWQSIFNLMKNWYITDLFLSELPDKLLGLEDWRSRHKKNEPAPSWLYFLFLPNPIDILNQYLDNPDEVLQQYLFCNSQFTKIKNAWHTDIFHFYGHKTEIITCILDKKVKRLKLADPESIAAVYQIPSSADEIITAESLLDITDYFNKNTGWLRVEGTPHEKLRILVMRYCYLQSDSDIRIYPDFFNQQFLKSLLKKYQKKLQKYSAYNAALYFDFEHVFPSVEDDHAFFLSKALLEKLPQKQRDLFYKRLAAVWLLPSEERIKALKLLRVLFAHLYSSNFIPLTLGKNKPVYLDADVSNPFLPLQTSKGSFIFRFDADKLVPQTSYFNESMIKIKCAASTSNGDNSFPVQASIFNLFNTRKNFYEKKFIVDWLFISGVNKFQFDFDGAVFDTFLPLLMQEERGNVTHTAYSQWFAYIHQLGHFLNNGKNRPDILVLFPFYEKNFGTLPQVYRELVAHGDNFDFILPPNFLDDKLCAIEDGHIIHKDNHYKILLLPGITYMFLPTLQKIEAFFQQGGIVIATDILPQAPIVSKNIDTFLAIRKRLWLEDESVTSPRFTQNDGGGLSYFLPSYKNLPETLSEVGQPYFKVQIISPEENPGVTHTVREKDDKVYLFFLNTNPKKEISCTVKSHFLGRPYQWNFDLGESQPYPSWFIRDNTLFFQLHLQGAESALFVIDRKKMTRIWQLLESDLDGCQIERQEREHFSLTGWKREEGKAKILVGKGKLEEYLSYEVKNKLPILAVSSQAWYLESDVYEGKINLGDLSIRFPELIQPVTYHKIIVIKRPYIKGQKLILDLGKVQHCCALYVNEQFVAQKLVPPWQFDISEFLREGENRISIRVINNFSNLLAVNSTLNTFRYPLQEFGLFGPVKLISFTVFHFEI